MLSDYKRRFENYLDELEDVGDVNAVHHDASKQFKKFYDELSESFKIFNEESFITLPNFDSVEDLNVVIAKVINFEEKDRMLFDTIDIDAVLVRISQVQHLFKRLDKKNLEVILKFHRDLKELFAYKL